MEITKTSVLDEIRKHVPNYSKIFQNLNNKKKHCVETLSSQIPEASRMFYSRLNQESYRKGIIMFVKLQKTRAVVLWEIEKNCAFQLDTKADYELFEEITYVYVLFQIHDKVLQFIPVKINTSSNYVEQFTFRNLFFNTDDPLIYFGTQPKRHHFCVQPTMLYEYNARIKLTKPYFILTCNSNHVIIDKYTYFDGMSL